ncbi:MAG: WbqC family protein [Candidatus Omnitrophota bacterium]|nr:WbqC family protein [Candidatus Omnitrophota bacterium]MBU1928497.1 WbqC family protein [Candidatus Omnitrophota bacterium]MBU2035430.1 WbqC family protein [Candidatus Omnitrophota bacterium]MBU2221438.1 WbqC family protein [Candidatus Omnitrophota bacterium]MBU2258238.1 WbqC family protein [Candidatus Omnitrophota bacterium]
MIISMHQPQYIPWLGYFDKIAKSDCFVFLDKVQYKPREFQNRNKVRAASGSLWLSVPVISKDKGRQVIDSVVVDNELPWQRKHLETFKSCYGKADFFDEHKEFLNQVYTQKREGLVDLNIFIIDYILKQLAIALPIYRESELDIRNTATDRIIDICRKLKADTYLSGAGGKEYLEEAKFPQAGIKLLYQDFKHPAYRQQFMKNAGDFMPCMSILDLLLNEGPKSREIFKRG